jgi:hypothetical protein
LRSSDLTREQLDRLQRELDRQRRYYVLLWKRSQANDMPMSDPLVLGICRTWEHVDDLWHLIQELKNAKPQPHRPLAKSGKTSGLAWREQPWAEQQLRAAEAVQREAQKPKTPQPP